MLQSSNNQYICNLLKSHFKNFLSLCFLPDSFRPEQNALRAGPDFLIHPLNRTSFLPGATTSATKDSSGFNSLVSLLLTLSFFLLLFFSPCCSRWGGLRLIYRSRSTDPTFTDRILLIGTFTDWDLYRSWPI